MLRATITSICFLVALASGFVAYLSQQAMEKAQRPSAPLSLTVHQVLDSEPGELDHVELNHYQPGKYFASRDYDEDQNWELVCVPFFPKEWDSLDNNYASCIVCFEGIANRKQLAKLIDQENFETNYWADRQILPVDIHFRLAKKYRSMDFEKCRILHYGFEPPQPFLGKNSLYASFSAGVLFVIFGLLNILFGLFSNRVKNANKLDNQKTTQTVNRAGLPTLGDEVEPSEDESSIELPVDEEQLADTVSGIAALLTPDSAADGATAMGAEQAAQSS